MSKKPLLSIGMIVKNEIRCLEKCLKALQPLRDAVPCELVIADTGSTDGTREIAAQYADICFDFAWIKDFAAARNAVMDHCSGEWYLSVDADEYLDDHRELAAFVQSDLKDRLTSGYVHINNLMSENDSSEYNMFQAQRLLNLASGFRYAGSIHERWPAESCVRAIHLEETVFWHDGYVNNGSLTDEAKGKRNMELLENELEKDPHNIILMMQAMESAYTEEQATRYARRTMEEFHAGTECQENIKRVTYRDMLRIASEYRLPEWEEWLKEAEEQVPDCLYTMMDIGYMALSDALAKNDYERTLVYCERYFAGLKKYNDNAYGSELETGPLLSSGKKFQESVCFSAAMACSKLQRWEEMRSFFAKVDPLTISKQSVMPWLTVLFGIWEKLDLQQTCRSVGEVWRSLCADENKKDVRKQFYAKACSLFMYVKPAEKEEYFPEQPPYPLIAAMEDCDLGRAAKVMLAQSKEEISGIIAGIENWADGIPVPVYMKLMLQGIHLPSSFFAQPLEALERIAANVGKTAAQQLEAMLAWNSTSGLEALPAVLLWRYLWTAAALRGADWESADRELLDRMVFRFEELAREFLVTCFQPAMLCEENIHMLPGIHRFAWYFLSAMEAQRKNDQVRYITCLRKGLHHAPVMKNMVDYLIKDFKKKQAESMATPEMRELAEKVRMLLAAYPPDDPAVMALKQTPAYQQVAFLIEEPQGLTQ